MSLIAKGGISMNKNVNKTAITLIYAIALIGGAGLWIAASVISGRSEAWDSLLYWNVAYPLAIALAGILGYMAPEKPWRWALAVMLVQPVVMMITTSTSFSLLPLGLILFAVLALPAIVIAGLGSYMKIRSMEAQ